jgi:hypothetical protein
LRWHYRFYDKLDIAADPRSPEHNKIREWLGDCDPHVIDELQIKISLGRIAKRKNAATARINGHAIEPAPPGREHHPVALAGWIQDSAACWAIARSDGSV